MPVAVPRTEEGPCPGDPVCCHERWQPAALQRVAHACRRESAFDWLHAERVLDHGEFRDLREAGYGNGGIVFQSVHLPSGRLVARKVPLSGEEFRTAHWLCCA